MAGFGGDFLPLIQGTNQTFFNEAGDFVGNVGAETFETSAGNKINALVQSKQLTVNKDEKTFSFGTANFNDIWKDQSAKLDPASIGPSPTGAIDLYGQITGPYINAYKDLVGKGFTPDTTSINFYNQALLTDVQLRGETKANLVSLADPKSTYEVFKTDAGWVSKEPGAPTTTTTAVKTSRGSRPGAPEVADLGEKRRVGAQAASFLGLSTPDSKSSILSGD